jgi:hypothetical protein
MAVVSPCREAFGLFQQTDETLLHFLMYTARDILEEGKNDVKSL